MKNRWLLFFVMLIGLCLIIPSFALCKDPIKIGVIRDLSGAAAELGRSQVYAQKMIFDEINEKGGLNGHLIEYEIGDEKASPDRAVSLAKRYINVNRVLLISGTTTSGAGLALMKYASEEEIPVFGHAYSYKLYEGELGKWYFGSGSTNIEFSKSWLNMAKRDGVKKVGVIWVNYEWGRGVKDICYEFGKDYGISVIGDVPVEMGTSEATAEVSKMKSMNPEAIIAPVLAKGTASLARAFAALNWNPVVYGLGPVMIPAMEMVDPKLLEGWRSPMIADPNDPRVIAVIEKYKAKYGSSPPDPGYFIETWDGTNVLIHVLKTMIEKGEPLTRINVRDAMEKYSSGVDLLSPSPRKSTGWGTPPHILARAEDFLPMRIKGGVFEKY